MNSKTPSPNFSTIFCALLCWIPFILLLPFLTITLIILGMYRLIVTLLARYLHREDLVRSLKGLDISFCTDNFFSNETQSSPHGALAFIHIINGKLSPELVKERVLQTLLAKEKCEENSESGGYEKLTSLYPGFWMGFPFWKKATKPFHIDNHIKVIHDRDGLTRSNELNKMVCQWMQEPFTPGISLWEIRIVLPQLPLTDESTSEHDTQSILILKTHHVIGDGKSMLQLLRNIFDNVNHSVQSTSKKRLSLNSNPSQCQNSSFQESMSQNQLWSLQGCNTNSSSNSNSMGWSPKPIHSNVFGTVWARISSYFSLTEVNILECKSLRKVFNLILHVFFTPLTIFILVRDFAIHRDSWFTEKKISARLNMATVFIPMERFKRIRKNLSDPLPLFPRVNGSPSRFQDLRMRSISWRQKPVSVTVIAVSALAGALCKLLKRARHDVCIGKSKASGSGNYAENKMKSRSQLCDDAVPVSSNFVIALPLQDESRKESFCNNWTHGILPVKMRETNSTRRLASINEYYWKMRSQLTPEIYHSLVKFHHLLPELVLRSIANYNMGASIGVTNLLGSSKPAFIGGLKIERQFAYFGLQWRHASMTLALVSYNNEVAATILANEDVIPTERDVEILLKKHFMNELELLSLVSKL